MCFSFKFARTAATDAAISEMMQSGPVIAAARGGQIGVQGQGPLIGDYGVDGVRVRLWRAGDVVGAFPVGEVD